MSRRFDRVHGLSAGFQHRNVPGNDPRLRDRSGKTPDMFLAYPTLGRRSPCNSLLARQNPGSAPWSVNSEDASYIKEWVTKGLLRLRRQQGPHGSMCL
jgi:hypothetical protein